MKKININITLKSPEEKIKYDVFGSINTEKSEIIYFDNDELKTKTKFNYKEYIFSRDNSEMTLKYQFNLILKTTGTVYIKDINQIIDFEIITKKLKKENNLVSIEYLLNDEKYLYEIKWM